MVCLRSVPGQSWGESQAYLGHPGLISVQIQTDWRECPQDKRDISTEQTGHVHRMVAIQVWRCPAKFLYVYWFLSLPILGGFLALWTRRSDRRVRARRPEWSRKEFEDSSFVQVFKTWAKGGEPRKVPRSPPSKKQARFLEGPFLWEVEGKVTFLEASLASKKVLRGTFRGLPPFAPLLVFCARNWGLNSFSLRSCRSSSVNFFFWFFAGKFGKFSGKFGGNFPGFFLTHRTKAQKIRGKFRSIFRKKIRSSKKIFRAKFTLQTCHLNNSWSFPVWNRRFQRVLSPLLRRHAIEGCNMFAYNWKPPAYNWASLLAIVLGSFFAYSWRLFRRCSWTV